MDKCLKKIMVNLEWMWAEESEMRETSALSDSFREKQLSHLSDGSRIFHLSCMSMLSLSVTVLAQLFH